MRIENLQQAADLMEYRSNVDAQRRVDLAAHVGDSLVPVSFGSEPDEHKGMTIEQRRTAAATGRANFQLFNRLVKLLPQHDIKGDFTMENLDLLRLLQSNVVNTQEDILTEEFGANYYIVGSRPIVLPRKEKYPFTELLLWPAADRVQVLDRTPGRPVPKTVAVMTSHYAQFKEQTADNLNVPLADNASDVRFDEKTGLFVSDDFGFSSVLNWWKKRPIVNDMITQPRVVNMHAPKQRWGYTGRTFDAVISDQVVDRFSILDNLIVLENDFGRGVEAAALIRYAINQTEE